MSATRRVEVGPVSLAVAEAGRGGRPVLLLHGFTGAKEDFGPAVDRLGARGWHAVAPDQRGHGKSDSPRGEAAYSLATLGADALALADALGWDRFALVGYSMGGMVAQVVALEAPARVDGLVLMDTSPGRPDGIDPALVALGEAAARAGGLRALLAGPGASPLPPALRTYAENALASASPMWLALSAELVTQRDRLERLRAVRTPTLVLVGEHDHPFVGPSRRMAEAIPGARLAVVPGAGHSPQSEQPEAWWAALAGFLDRLKERAA